MSTIENVLFERLCENMNKRKASDPIDQMENNKIKTTKAKKTKIVKIKKTKVAKKPKKIEKLFGFTNRKKYINVRGAPHGYEYGSHMNLHVVTNNDTWCKSDINIIVKYLDGDVIIKKNIYDEMVSCIGEEPHIVSKSMYGGGVTSKYIDHGLIVTGKSNIQYDFPNVSTICRVCNECKDAYSTYEPFKIDTSLFNSVHSSDYHKCNIIDKIMFDYKHDEKAIIKGVCVDCYLKNSIVRMESKFVFECKYCNKISKIATFSNKYLIYNDSRLSCEECYKNKFSDSFFPEIVSVKPGEKVPDFLKFKVVP